MPMTMPSTTACASASACWTAAWRQVLRAWESPIRPLLQPMESISPWPRKRRRESSNRQITQRVAELPASRPTANCGLAGIGASDGRDAVVESQVKRAGGGHFAMDVRVVIQEILQARGE